MILSFLWIIFLCVLTGAAGFFWGRWGLGKQLRRTEAEDGLTGGKTSENGEENDEGQAEKNRDKNREKKGEGGERGRHPGRHRHREESLPDWVIGSPAAGQVLPAREGEEATVVIDPFEDKLYAPAAGKITNIRPVGNEIIFLTEFGVELQIRVGEVRDELLGCLFRPRIVKNEVVARGKLLLEFDPEGLKREGCFPYVSISVRGMRFGSKICLTAEGKVKPGEEIMSVKAQGTENKSAGQTH
jgi:phosphotransferase system IIA component